MRNYRADIDGLRAFAVLGVLLFHAGYSAFAGGFVGVDVFFVISGYLISGGILEDVKSGRFSYAGFYTRRARRILPALIFTVAITFAAGTLFLSPDGLRVLAKESTHALLSIANIQYWRESYNYFAPSSDQLALLHFWSLSVEEQFYLFWPAFILLALKVGRPRHLVGIAAIASFATALMWGDRQAVFFLTPFRVFEFAIGALVAFSSTPKTGGRFAEVSSLAGLAAIVGCMMLVTKDSSFVLTTLVPCLGAAAVIMAEGRSATARLLATPVLLKIGKASYSIYLIHWPLIFFADLVFGDAARHGASRPLILMLSLAAGFLMYRHVEQPFRRNRSPGRKALLKYAAAILLCAAVTHAAFLSNGWAWRLSKDQLARMELMGFGWLPCAHVADERCAFGDLKAPVGLEMIGDSFAMHYVAGLDPLLRKHRLRGEVSEVGGCLLLEGVDPVTDGWKKSQCAVVRDREIGRIKRTETPLVIAQNWESYADDNVLLDGKPVAPGGDAYSAVEAGINRLIEGSSPERRFVLVGAQPMMRHCLFQISRELPAPIAHARGTDSRCPPKPRNEAESEGAAVERMLRRIAARWQGRVVLLSPVDFLCDESCPVFRGDLPMFRDAGHLTVAGSQFVGARAAGLFEALLRDRRTAPPSEASAKP